MDGSWMNINKVPSILFSSISLSLYTIIVILSWNQYPEFHLWKDLDFVIISFFNSKFTLLKATHLILGIPFIALGSYHLPAIIQINSQASDGRLYVHTLLTDGYYGNIRHPMYSSITHLYFGLFYGLCSSLSLPLMIFFSILFYVFSIFEERYMLIPQFGDSYVTYMTKVGDRILNSNNKIIYSIYIGIITIGLYFT
ncbi:MAG: isoprenylcysteine carboxylmethyltransferase family protein [Asgard group archaeon]|nr:isoprenylcysteine carboxylmethyltransferase family protein [Asgard group archaeon]